MPQPIVIGKVDKGETNFALLSGNGELSPVSDPNTTITVYGRRYLMLALFCIFSFSNAYQWIHLNIISNVLASYYNESLPSDEYQRNTAIDWLSVVYMLAYIPLIIPVTWFLDKKGLRQCCIVGSFLNLLGAALKCASVAPDRFPLLMFSQTICAIAQLFILGIPARMAAVWFGPNEVSTATSLGVFGNQAGIAFGFLVPPILVPNSEDIDIMSKGFYIMFGAGSFVIGVIFLLICIFFQEKPPQPPSRAQQLSVEAAIHENYLQSLKRLFQNQGFIILMISYGCNTGSFYAISTLLNAIILNYFKGEEENAGRIGLTIIVMGILGSVVAGILLDKTKAFKATTIGIYLLCLLSTLAFTFTLDLHVIAVVFVTAGALGFFMTGYLPVGFEFAAELTFPESEATSSGLLNASAQVFGIILTLGMRAMMDSINVLIANITMCVILLFGTIISCLIKADYRRQAAGKTFHSQEVIVSTEGNIE
ncbi:Feline leukemia virus subgroup C receptor- protein 2 [Bulinus truncatus]|nr:Feline leukemia virus subgroup C receptor- protein 2 [Bulinus truncatus]